MAAEQAHWSVTLSDIDLGPEEEAAVLEVLRSRWLTMGERTTHFEQAFEQAVGARHAVAVSNGTAALHLALACLGIGPGDEVIVPSLTFVATANAVLYCGARPVFADIVDVNSLLMDPEDVQRKVTERTRAIIPVHYAGYPCDMDSFLEIASQHGLRIVEDAAHAPGARYGNRTIGSIGTATCFSFFSNKNLVTGEGGMITTQDDALAAMIRRRRSHGMTALSLDKHRGHAFTYDVTDIGWNYRLTEIESALGMVQLAKLERNNSHRRNLVARYRVRLADAVGVTVPFAGLDDTSSCHIMVVVLPTGVDRAGIQTRMKDRGIQTSVHYPPIHRFSAFSHHRADDLPKTGQIAQRLMTLPLHARMTGADVDLVCDAFRDALAVVASGLQSH